MKYHECDYCGEIISGDDNDCEWCREGFHDGYETAIKEREKDYEEETKEG